MKVVVVEPLGVDRKELDRLAAEILGNDVEWVYYENREDVYKRQSQRAR